MSYEEPFNGDYDHQDLFGIGEQVWYAWWDVNTVKYEARLVEIKKIIIDINGVVYMVEYVDDDLKSEHIDEIGEPLLFESADEAGGFARKSLRYALEQGLHDAELQVEITKQHYDKAVFDYSVLNESMKKLEEK